VPAGTLASGGEGVGWNGASKSSTHSSRLRCLRSISQLAPSPPRLKVMMATG